MAEGPLKKRYFKKEKKEIRLKRHKAKSASQLKTAEKTGLRRGVQVKEQPKRGKGQLKLPKVQFPKIPRFITEWFGRLTTRSFGKLRASWFSKKGSKANKFTINIFDSISLGSFFKLSAFGNFSKKQIRRAKKKNFWLSIILVVSLVFACFLGWKLWDMYSKWQQVQKEYVKLERELTVWESVTKQYPSYRDAYFEEAILAYRLGKKDKEVEYLQKTLSIDPNFQPALELKKLSK